MKLTFTAFLLFITASCFAQTIPLNRTFNWTNSGYQGNYLRNATVIDFLTVGGVADGLTDNSVALQNAIANAPKPVVIYFPGGNYLFNSSINLPDSTILRGATSDSTNLLFDFSGAIGNGINISGTTGPTFTNVTSGAERFSNSVVVDDASLFNVGDYAEIMQTNGTWDTQPVSWADNSIGQIVRISAISSNTLTFDEVLRINYDYSLNPRIRKIIPKIQVGLECLKIERLDDVAVGVCFNVNLSYAAQCWITGVEIGTSIGSHIEIDASTNITVSRSYIHDNFAYDGTSTHGYGITLFGHTGQCRIENNIMRHLRHSFSLQCGANGNVVAYNYSTEPNRSEFPADFGADISMHGHFSYANLFEGNIVQNIQIDQTWGPSGPLNTFFRNRAELYGLLMTSGTVQSDSINFVGNEVSNIGPFLGNYSLAGSGHFEFANNIRGTITPSGTIPLPDTSYYLDSIPDFWTSSIFPTIGDPSPIGSGSIPAKDRFNSGAYLAPCVENVNTAIANYFNSQLFHIYPNPFDSEISIFSEINKNDRIEISITDISGKTVFEKENIFKLSDRPFQISTKDLAPGIYIVRILNNNSWFSQKIIKY
ncbi:MAG: T9SS type A sorting domain-containing protein [Bacteroidia bacterium]|nr:T9SS type A sorting domain-containing protein [Bacteroidia bacterium]